MPCPVLPLRLLYRAVVGGAVRIIFKMKQVGDNRWSIEVKGDLKAFTPFDIGRGETPGVFAKAVSCNGGRAAVVDMRDTNPAGWENDRRLTTKSMADLVLYELHHRDFSIDPSSGLVNKGKFLALTEKKAIAHLKALGVNAVHILPSYDFASIDEAKYDTPQYNWGYGPLNYNVPEGSYSFDAELPAATRILEFKQMVQALHQAGIRVVLDVVYNHTFSLEGSNFDRTFPKAYYRYRPDGTPSDGSGCGNETASEKPLMREFDDREHEVLGSGVSHRRFPCRSHGLPRHRDDEPPAPAVAAG